MEKEKDTDVLVFDGNSLAHRVRHTINLTHPNTGEDVSVLYGFLSSMHKVYKKFWPKCIIVCWDMGVPDKRYELYQLYKRRDHKDDPSWPRVKEQMNVLHEQVLPMMGVLSLRADKTEADDLIGQLLQMLNSPTVLVTSDKDMWQFLELDHVVSVYDGVKNQETTRNNFEKRTGGVTLDAWPLYRALVGDSSDKIKGVPGIGPKTAGKIVEHYIGEDELYIAAATGPALDLGLTKSVVKKILKFGHANLCNIVDAMDLFLDTASCKRYIAESILDVWQSPQWEESMDWMMSQHFDSLIYSETFHRMVKNMDDPSKFADVTMVEGV